MEQSELERGRFHQRVNKLLDLMLVKPASFNQLPVPPIYKPTNSLDQVIDRAKFTFQSSIWRRSKHILVSIKTYGGAGFISQVITMSTLLIETWGLTHYLVRAITDYRKTEDLERLNDVCAEIFNCMQAFIALPSSNYELDRSIDLRAELKNLETKFPTVLEIYDSLNDATLLNNIEYYKWWVVWQYSSKPKTKDSYIKYYK